MEKVLLKDVKPGDQMLVPRCGFWEVESIDPTRSGKMINYKYKELSGHFKGKPDKVVTVMRGSQS